MNKKLNILLILLLLSSPIITNANTADQIEIYNINEGKVILKTEATDSFQERAKEFLDGITNVYGKFEPIPKEGIMVRVPFAPSVMVDNQWVSTLIDELVIILPNDEDPHLMIFDDENNMHFFSFEGDFTSFLVWCLSPVEF